MNEFSSNERYVMRGEFIMEFKGTCKRVGAGGHVPLTSIMHNLDGYSLA